MIDEDINKISLVISILCFLPSLSLLLSFDDYYYLYALLRDDSRLDSIARALTIGNYYEDVIFILC